MTETRVNGGYSAPLQVKQFQYNPQPDICVYELALVLPLFTMAMAGGNVTGFVESLPPEAKRHFKEMTG